MLIIRSKNGTGSDIEFIYKETGENLSKKLCIEFGATIILDHLVTANLQLCMVEIDIEVDKVNWLLPHPGRPNKELTPISNILFRNGDKIEFKEDGNIIISLSSDKE